MAHWQKNVSRFEHNDHPPTPTSGNSRVPEGHHCNISSSFCNSKRRLEPATKSMEFCQIWAANAVWGYYKVRGDEVCGWVWLRPEACHAPQTSRGFLLGFASTRAMVPWRFAWCPRGDRGVVFGDGLSHIPYTRAKTTLLQNLPSLWLQKKS